MKTPKHSLRKIVSFLNNPDEDGAKNRPAVYLIPFFVNIPLVRSSYGKPRVGYVAVSSSTTSFLNIAII
jgi:hypothetical protein